MIRLVYLPVNQAWMFTFGDYPLPMGDHGTIFNDRGHAVTAANQQGLEVNDNDFVTSIQETNQ
jgi:hypothetical protein